MTAISRRSALGLLVATASAPRLFAKDVAAESALERGVQWLLSQQHADGGWHSAVYGQMACGVGNTALIIAALSRLPPQAAQRRAIDRGLKFLFTNPDPTGFVRAPDGDCDFPVYSAALVLMTLDRLPDHPWQPAVERLQRGLVAAQCAAHLGWSTDDVDFGGWISTGPLPAGPRRAGRSNLSVTAHALLALKAGGPLADAVRSAALQYATRQQNLRPDDGGFHFAPQVDDPLNKAGQFSGSDRTSRARSYGSATVDGTRLLLACGVPAEDPRRTAALAWLQRNSALHEVPGFAAAVTQVNVREGLLFYYLAGLANLLRELPATALAERRAALIEQLIQRQRADGAWLNRSPFMREDDPLLATALAVDALA